MVMRTSTALWWGTLSNGVMKPSYTSTMQKTKAFPPLEIKINSVNNGIVEEYKYFGTAIRCTVILQHCKYLPLKCN